jgi:hypothetical protein
VFHYIPQNRQIQALFDQITLIGKKWHILGQAIEYIFGETILQSKKSSTTYPNLDLGEENDNQPFVQITGPPSSSTKENDHEDNDIRIIAHPGFERLRTSSHSGPCGGDNSGAGPHSDTCPK